MKRILLITILAAFLCTGCGLTSDISLDEEQNDIVAEYAAGVMLKYSYKNEWNYTKVRNAMEGAGTHSTTSPTKSGTTIHPTTSPTKAPETTTSAATTDPMQILSKGLGFNGATINYTKYYVGATYPEKELVLAVAAPTGKKVVAVEFEISNDSSEPLVCNTKNTSATVKLLFNGTEYQEYYTILSNDLINLDNISVAPKGKYTAVAVFMVPETAATQITGLSLNISAGGTSATYKIK